MTPLPAKVTAIGKQGQQYRAVVQIRSKYRGSVTTLVFGELKPHSGSLNVIGKKKEAGTIQAFALEYNFLLHVCSPHLFEWAERKSA